MTDKRIRIILDSREAQRNAKELDSSMREVGRTADNTVFSVKKLAAAIASAFVTQQISSFFANSISAAIKFEAAVSDLAAITGATGADLKFLSEAAREFGATTTLSATQAVEAIKLIASAKPDLLDNAQALKAVTKEAIALSEAAGIDLSQAAATLGTSLNQFNLDASESARVINVLAAGAKFGSSEIADTSEALKNAGVSAAVAKVSFESANAAIQVLAASGIKSAEAGTGLRNVITILDTNVDKKLRPSLVGLAGALKELESRNLSSAEMVDLFGRENINAGQILVRNIATLLELEKKLKGTNTAYEQQKIRTNNLQGDIKALNSAYEELQISVGELFNAQARESVTGLANATRFLAENLEGVFNVVEVLAAALGARLAVAVASSAAAFVSSVRSEVAAINAASAAANAASVSVSRYTGAITTSTVAAQRATIANQLLARATAGAGAAIALLGGPVGILAIAAAAFLSYKSNAKEAIDATNVLAESTDNLSAAQAANLKLKTRDALAQQREEIAKLSTQITELTALYEKYGNRGGQASRNNASDQARVADEIERTKVALGLADENAKKLEARLKSLSDVTKGENIAANTPALAAAPEAAQVVSDQKTKKEVRQDESFKTEIASAQSTTAALERELNYRRQISQIYRDGELSDTASMYEQALAMQRVQEQTQLAEVEARYAEDVARRQERFLASINNDAIEREQKDALRKEYESQLLLSAELFEQEKTAIQQQGANDRSAVERAEMQARMDNAKALGGALMSLGQGQSKKVFKIGQTLALAQASAALPSAVIQSFQNGGGYPWGLVPAGAMLATGLANINNIRKAGSGLGVSGGGSTPSISLPSGSSSSLPSNPTGTASSVQGATQQPTQYAVTFKSDGVFTGEWINNQLKELKKSGGVIVSND